MSVSIFQVNVLSALGGSTDSVKVYNILAHLIYHDLAKTIRYTEQPGKIKFTNYKSIQTTTFGKANI